MGKQSMGLAREIVMLQHLTSAVVQPRALATQAVGRINLWSTLDVLYWHLRYVSCTYQIPRECIVHACARVHVRTFSAHLSVTAFKVPVDGPQHDT